MERWILGMLVFLLLSLTGEPAEAKEDHLAESWSLQAEEIDHLVKKGKLEEAGDKLSRLAESFSRGDFSELEVSVEGIGALSGTLVEMDQELTRVMPEPKSMQDASEKMRMAFDALAHPDQPFWHRYTHLIRKDMQRMKEGIKKDHPETVRSSAEALKAHFKQMEPALLVSRRPETVNAVGSLFRSIGIQAEKIPLPVVSLQAAVVQSEKMLPALIRGEEEDVLAAMGIRPDWQEAALTLSGVIALTLAYVGWKKYRYGRKQVYERG